MNEIRRRIDEELSDLTFDRIAECKRKAIHTTGKDKNMKINKKALALCVAATVAVGCAVTAGAVTGWDYSRLIYGFFPETDGDDITIQAEVLGGTLQTIDAQKITNTFENYDVSFDGALFDGTVLMVSATVKNKDGSPFADSEYDFKSIRFPEGARSGSGGCSLNDDGSLRLYSTMMYADADNYPTAAYTFEGFCRYPDYPERFEMLDSGSFTVEFNVNVGCETRNFMLTDHYGNTIEVQLSPISVKYTMPDNIPDEERYKYNITVMDENGVLLSRQNVVQSCSQIDQQTGIKNEIMCFSRPLDINAVTSVTGAAYTNE